MEFKQEWKIPALVGLGSFGIGVFVGHILTKYRLKMEFEPEDEEKEKEVKEVQLQFELDESRRLHQRDLQQEVYAAKELKEAAIQAKNVLDEFKDSKDEIFTGKFTHSSEPSNEEDDEEEDEEMSILDNDESIMSVFSDEKDEDWDYPTEIAKRNPNVPYTVHRDEFFENPDDHNQSTLTYYKGDNILCDTDDTPIYDPDNFVGKVLEFGRGSQDPNVVYIRNERLMADYEVLLDHGYYQVEVLGQALADNFKADEVKHHKFKLD